MFLCNQYRGIWAAVTGSITKWTSNTWEADLSYLSLAGHVLIFISDGAEVSSFHTGSLGAVIVIEEHKFHVSGQEGS